MTGAAPAGTVRRRVVVRGRVQGVFFRQSCREAAEDAGVVGWVRNRPDGTVEVLLEGAAPAVERMVAWCRQGSRRSVVTGVEVVEEPPEGLTGFHVR